MEFRWTLVALAAIALWAATPARAGEDTVDISNGVPQAKDIQEGLFPDDECEQLKAAGFKCMGFKAAVRYSLPAANFKAGSAELPELLKQQLDAFGDALKGRTSTTQKIRVEGHADATGSPAVNLELSQRRAEAARQYLIDRGVPAALLIAIGVGATDPKPGTSPQSPENRRVVIARDEQPDAK